MSPRAGPARVRVDGVLLLDKPSGASSNVVLQRARRLFNALKAGHTGTLDPLASGLLPLCFGEATKFSQVLLDARKEYVATIRFGISTTTGDAEGDVVSRSNVRVTRLELEDAVARFLGRTRQLPPRYSALKFQGRNLYEYARAGIEVPRSEREIQIDALEVMAHDGDSAVLRIACSKGTYIRTLAEDVATRLGTVAHLGALRRTASAGFRVEQAHALEAIEAVEPRERSAMLLPVDAPLVALPKVVLDGADAERLCCGQQVPGWPEMERARAYDGTGRFVGVVTVGADGRLRAVRLVDTAAPGNGAGTESARLAIES